MKRTLRLNREALTALTTDDLGDVVGAQADFSRVGFTCPVRDCAGELTVLPQCQLTFAGC